MALIYGPQTGFGAGQPVSVSDPNDAATPTKQVLIPAFTPVNAAGVQSPAGTSADPTYTQSSALPAGTDRSGTANTTSGPLAAANATRRGLNIQNVGANNIGVNEFGGVAAIGSPGTYTIVPNGSINVRTNRAVTVIAVTAATAYSATEF